MIFGLKCENATDATPTSVRKNFSGLCNHSQKKKIRSHHDIYTTFIRQKIQILIKDIQNNKSKDEREHCPFTLFAKTTVYLTWPVGSCLSVASSESAFFAETLQV